MNFNPEKGDFLRLVESVGSQRVFEVIDSSLEHMLQAEPSVSAVAVQPVESAQIVESTPRLPHGVVDLSAYSEQRNAVAISVQKEAIKQSRRNIDLAVGE